MESKLLKIKPNANSRVQFDSLISFMTEKIKHPISEMVQKGYFWDSIFHEKNKGFKYIYIVIK